MSLAFTLGLPVSWNGLVVPLPSLTEVSSIKPMPEYRKTVSIVGTFGELSTH